MFLDEEKFRKRVWEINCPEMILACRGERRRSRRFEGSGFVRCTEEGKIVFKVISRRPSCAVNILDFLHPGHVPGELIPENEMFDLEAVDIGGRKWASQGILPRILPATVGVLVEGSLSEIVHADARVAGGNSWLSLAFYGDYEIPCNDTPVTESREGVRLVNRSETLNVSRSKLSGHSLTARYDQDRLRIDVQLTERDRQVPPVLAARLEQALEFVFGQPMRAAVIEAVDGDGQKAWLRSALPAHRSGGKIMPPLIEGKVGGSGDFWRLLDAFFCHIERDEGDSRPPISRHLQYLFVGNWSSFELQALAWSTCVESILEYEYASAGGADPEFINGLNRAVGFVTKNEEGDTKERLLGILNSKRNASASEKLKQLVRDGVVREDQRKAWNGLRHRAAHGAMRELKLDNDRLLQCASVRTLAHCLVFHRIGYRGKFTDYGRRGAPTHGYPFASDVP